MPLISKYNIDGRTIIGFNRKDFEFVGISNRVHIKKILLELEKIYPSSMRENYGFLFLMRRERIRKHRTFEDATITIQRAYRGYLGRKYVLVYKEKKRLDELEAQRQQKVKESGTWWSSRNVSQSVIEQLMSPNKEKRNRKTFGRFRDHLSVQGYGRWEGGEFKIVEGVMQDDNPSRRLTEKLVSSGYEARRKKQFLAQLELRMQPKTPVALPPIKI